MDRIRLGPIHGVWEQLRMTPLYKDYIFRYTDSWLNFKEEKIVILENRDDQFNRGFV